MYYQTARPLIESGDVIAFSNDGWETRSDLESQAVRFFTRSEFSHVASIIRADDRLKMIEAVVPKVRIVPLSEITGGFYWIPMRKSLSSAATKYARSLEGQDYSKIEAILGYFGLDKEENNKWQCAELKRSILRRNGTILPGRSTPTSVIKDCMSMGNPLILVTP